MQKVITQFKSIIDGVESYFHFDGQCPTATAKMALLECLKWIGQIEDLQKSQTEAAKANEEPAPVTEEEHPKVEALEQPKEEAPQA